MYTTGLSATYLASTASATFFSPIFYLQGSKNEYGANVLPGLTAS